MPIQTAKQEASQQPNLSSELAATEQEDHPRYAFCTAESHMSFAGQD
jgi:hypothetical protein